MKGWKEVSLGWSFNPKRLFLYNPLTATFCVGLTRESKLSQLVVVRLKESTEKERVFSNLDSLQISPSSLIHVSDGLLFTNFIIVYGSRFGKTEQRKLFLVSLSPVDYRLKVQKSSKAVGGGVRPFVLAEKEEEKDSIDFSNSEIFHLQTHSESHYFAGVDQSQGGVFWFTMDRGQMVPNGILGKI